MSSTEINDSNMDGSTGIAAMTDAIKPLQLTKTQILVIVKSKTNVM